jgi:predicted RNA binding protein YcfA (HicA-like mRNA interferase family)
VPITARRLVRFLKRRGWTESRQHGSHLILSHSDFPDSIVVPMHARELRKGLFLHILKSAGATLDDFYND